MKRKYIKPIFAAESFQLDAAIAATCSSDGKHALNHYANNCSDATGYYFGQYPICETDVVTDSGDLYDELCYHASVADQFIYS